MNFGKHTMYTMINDTWFQLIVAEGQCMEPGGPVIMKMLQVMSLCR